MPILAHEVIALDRRTLTRDGHVYLTDASDIGLKVNQWPGRIEIDGHDAPFHFHRLEAQGAFGVMYAVYTSAASGDLPVRLHVFND